MKLSVVIPALDEGACIGECVSSALAGSPHEVIVVDGGSSDGTVEAARAAGARVVHSAAGRGVQQNEGARAAGGDVLLFLHADTRLPAGYQEKVAETLSREGVAAGAFRFRLEGHGLGLRWLELTVAWRCRLFGMPYGDQAIFLTAETFEQVGGFPESPIMEDYELIRRVGRLGRVAIADADAVTSARRYERLGMWRAVWSHQACLMGHWLNLDPERIARWRL